ncbi:hypothetical protein [Sphingomonas bacterium]|uniref:hypothetical protein n=1 Tax=Sphingomonas bacterium TaxID=1895847 RepID=UPI001575F070|nr:hypothetical protein [Sphingomonas bacterium]
MPDPHPDTTPEDLALGNPDSAGEARDDDARSDLEQAVAARSDAVDRGEGAPAAGPLAATGDYSGNAGTGGEVKNQDKDAQ